VFRAIDEGLGRAVALKIPHEARDAARFEREARAAAAVRHPHVCPVYDVGEESGLPYVVMELVEGGSLESRLKKEGKLDPREAARVVREAALGLQAVHDAGIVHRDIKPGNILLDAGGMARVTDFGLAKGNDSATMTAEGALVGTPAYMAPEVVSLEGVQAGPSADVYALGAVLYQAVTGKMPYMGAIALVLTKIVQGPPPVPSTLTPGLDLALERVILKAMAREPGARYATAREMAEALEAWLSGKDDAPGTVRLEAPKPPRRGWIVAAVAGFAAASLLLVPVIIEFINKKGEKQEIKIDADPDSIKVKVQLPPLPRDHPLAKLPAIPEEERFAWQPDGLVAVFGSHAWKHWGLAKTALEFATDRKALIAIGFDGRAAASWDAATGKPLRRFEMRGANNFFYIPTGRLVALHSGGTGDWTLKLWKLDSGEEVGSLTGTSGTPYYVNASPDGSVLVTVAQSNAPELWDLKKGERLALGKPPRGDLAPGEPEGVGFTEDGSQVLATYRNNSVKDQQSVLWVIDVASRKVVAQEVPDGCASLFLISGGFPRQNVNIGPDGNLLLCVRTSAGDELRKYDLKGRKWLPWKDGAVHPASRMFPALSPDGKRFVHANAIHDVETGKRLAELSYWIQGPAFSPDGKLLGGLLEDGRIVLYDTATGKRLSPEAKQADLLAVSPDGATLALRDGPESVVLTDTVTGKAGRRFRVKPGDVLRSAAFAQGGKVVVVGDNHGGLLFYDARSGDRIVRSGQEASGAILNFLAVSANGQRVASGGLGPPVVGVWDTASGKHVATITKIVESGRGYPWLSLSADGSLLALVQGLPWKCEVYEVASGKRLFSQPCSTIACALSPDGKRAVFSGAVWDVASGKKLLDLQGKPAEGYHATYSPDGTAIIASIGQGRVAQWSADGKLMKEWKLPTEPPRLAVANGHLFLGNANGTVYVVRLAQPPAKDARPE
jgi:WD40 repeat protein